MAVSTAPLASTAAESRNLWLHTRTFDLRFVTLSVVLVAGPYLVYLLLLNMGALLAPLTNALGTTADDLSRNFVNASVALLVGGPHMYATWTRTGLDRDFAAKHRKFLLAGLVIPVIVTTLALFNLALVIFLVLWQVVGFSFDAAFDRGYYIAVLSFLWMHYYQDHFLFVHPEAIEGKSLA